MIDSQAQKMPRTGHGWRFIDLAGLGPGQYTLDVHADSSPDAGVTRVEPASVQVRITRGK